MPTIVTPLVSIIIPCYRQAQFLKTAIDSACNQRYPQTEILVVNDGSDDDTESVARSYGNRVKYIYRPNGGLSAARNTAIALAQGAYFKFLDADDHLHPEQISWHMEALAGRDDKVSMTGVRLYRDGVPEEFEDHAPTGYQALIPFLLQENKHWMPPVGYLVPAGLVRAVGGFNECYSCFEDWDFFSRIGMCEPVLHCDPRIGAYYRLRPGSMSANRRRMAKTLGQILVALHDVCRERGRADWFGRDLLKAEQSAYCALVMQGSHDPQLLEQLVARIKELQRREGFGQYGWRFRLLASVVGYASAERIRCHVVKLLNIRPPESLDTGTWREKA